MLTSITAPLPVRLLPVLCAAALPAQAPTYAVARSYGLAAPGESLGRTVSGDVTGDLLPDLVVRTGTGARMLVNPGCLDRTVIVPATGTIHDIAILGDFPTAGRSRLAIASELEIELLGYAPSAASGSRWSSVVVPDPLAANAARLRTADVDGTGTDDLVVVCADQRTLRYELHLGNGLFTPAAGFTMPHDVLDVQAIELDGSAGDELAILATNGLHLRQPDGDPIRFVRNAIPGEDALCVLRHPGFGNRVLYTTYGNSGSNHLLLQIGAGGLEASWDLGGFHPVGLQVSDFDHDGDADLLVTETNAGALRILLNDHTNAGVPSFSLAPGNHLEVVVSSVTTPNAANARWFDANLDGELDLFLPVEATSEVRGLIGNALPPPSGGQNSGPLSEHPVFRHARYRGEDLQLELYVGPNTGPWNQMEVTVWLHRWQGDPEQSAQTYWNLPTEPGTEHMFVNVAMEDGDHDLPFSSQNRYYLTVRKVLMNGPTTTSSSTVYVGGWCGGRTDPPDPETVILRNDSDPGYAPIPYTNMRSGDQTLGLFVPMPRVPHFVPGLE